MISTARWSDDGRRVRVGMVFTRMADILTASAQLNVDIGLLSAYPWDKMCAIVTLPYDRMAANLFMEGVLC